MKQAPIGTKYRGPQGFADTNAGVYWEVMFLLSDDELKIQKALLRPAPQRPALISETAATFVALLAFIALIIDLLDVPPVNHMNNREDES